MSVIYIPFMVGRKLSCRAHQRGMFVAQAIGIGCLFMAGGALAQSVQVPPNSSALGTAQDCTEIKMGYVDDPTLTDNEKRALMDRSLYQSLSRFDACQTATSGGGSSESGGGGGSAGGTGQSGSVASSDMSGTEMPPSQAQDGTSMNSTQSQMSKWSNSTGEEGELMDESATENGVLADNGKVPDDIPSADNDSVLEAQIRQAAMNETDPEIQARLWNEYRRYKGLPATD